MIIIFVVSNLGASLGLRPKWVYSTQKLQWYC